MVNFISFFDKYKSQKFWGVAKVKFMIWGVAVVKSLRNTGLSCCTGVEKEDQKFEFSESA